MDRLICGDVGFGKTEVALRAAFVVAMSGKQVALVCPTTLLARQHYATFAQRFQGWPVKVRRLSRLVPTAEANETREALAKGEVEIVIGTHAVLSKQVSFKDLGLVIVDEEQHFGVKHKEALKALRAEVHVMTLTATPIPRTLQMALSGIREMSIIATPPVDRLAVRTYVTPWDPVSIREALLREKYRGGQAYYVAPRISDLSRKSRAVPSRAGARGEVRRRPRPDAADAARRRHERLLRGPIRRAAQHHDRRVRPGRSRRQHPDHPPRRHVRPVAALPDPRPRRPRQGPRLCLSDDAAEQADHAGGGEAAPCAAVARQPRRRLPAGQPRPRYPRRRQSAGGRAVRPYPRDRRRTLSADAGGCRRGPQGAPRQRRRRGGPRLVAADQHRCGGADPRSLCARSQRPPRALPPSVRSRARGRPRVAGR